MSIGQFSIGETALAQQAAVSSGRKAPRSRQAVAKPDSAAMVPEAR